MKFLITLLFCLFSFITFANAQIQDDRYPQQQNNWSSKAKKQPIHYNTFRASVDRGTIIGGRPSGCPYRFCACALSLHLFGRIIPHLNLANNWRSYFPRAHAAPGMVAARSGHAFKLLAHISGNDWTVWDANSGGGRIRIHKRSIAGYTIVNPNGRG